MATTKKTTKGRDDDFGGKMFTAAERKQIDEMKRKAMEAGKKDRKRGKR